MRHTTNGQFMQCISEREALIRLLGFLETGKNRTRPAYDGVILLLFTDDFIAPFLKMFKKHNLYDRLLYLVSGYGSLSQYIKAQRRNKNSAGVMTVEGEHARICGKRVHPRYLMSDDKTLILFQI